MMKVLRKKRKGGFTLIELIVVIAILGILAAIAIPRFSGLSASSKVKADASTALQIVNAARIQETDTGTAVTAGDPATTVTATYMDVPASSQSGGAFAISGGGANPYVVTWTPTTAKAPGYVTAQTVTEGTPFVIATP